LERALGVSVGDSLFGFSAGGTEKRLRLQFPELKSVQVGRTLAAQVRVVYLRRRAAAKVWDNGQWLGMDEEGGVFPLRVFAPEDAPPEGILPEERTRPLPILSGVSPGPSARAALEFAGILRRLPQPWARTFYKMKLASSGEAVLFLKDGPVVRWGEPAPEEAVVQAKAERLERALRHPRLAGGAESVRFVDERRIAVKPKLEARGSRLEASQNSERRRAGTEGF
jgi:cell division septal protein FtsQ